MIALTRNGPTPAPQRGPVESLIASMSQPPSAAVPSHNAAERARDASVEARLDNGQKTGLVILAKQAWERIRLVQDGIADADTWRQEQAVVACGCRISEARVKHFSILKRHFADLAGRAGVAFKSAMREGTEAERIAMVKLEEACAARDLRMDYPAAIARKQFKGAALKDLNAKQLWCLVYTIRNRRKAVKKPRESTAPANQRTRDYTLKRPAKPAPPNADGNPF